MTTPIEIGARGAYAKAARVFEKPWEDLSEATRVVYMAEIAAALEAIEAAGYAVVPIKVPFDAEADAIAAMDDAVEAEPIPAAMSDIQRHMRMGEVIACNSRTFRAAWAAVLKAAPPLVKET